jgi:hypothetical protein
MSFKVYVEHSIVTEHLNIFIIEKKPDGRKFIAKPVNLTFETMPDHITVEPSIEIPGEYSREFLQSFADAIEKTGIRPTGKPVLENELTATKYHLEDMRTLVFRKE